MSSSVAKRRRLSEIASFVSGGTPNRQVASYWGGDTPWISAKDLKTLYVDSSIDTLSAHGREVASLVPAGALLILVRGMTLFKTVPIAIVSRELAFNQDVKALLVKDDVIPLFLAYSLQAREPELLKMVEAAGHGTGRLATEALRDVIISVPAKPIQERVVLILSTWDAAVERAEALISASKRRLAWLRDHLLHSSQGTRRTRLSDVTKELTRRNRSGIGRELVMAVTKQRGMRPMRQETIAESVERYKSVPPFAFAYNPMRLNIGSITMSTFDGEVLVSPDYVVFECDGKRLLPGYLNHLRHSRVWKHYFEAAGKGGVRVRIYYDDLAAFAFDLPPIDVQRRIVEVLDMASVELELLQRMAATLRVQKRGLMKKLLTGEWRLPPTPAGPPKETA